MSNHSSYLLPLILILATFGLCPSFASAGINVQNACDFSCGDYDYWEASECTPACEALEDACTNWLNHSTSWWQISWWDAELERRFDFASQQLNQCLRSLYY